MNQTKLVIWDFDGVIVDSRKLALERTQFQFKNVTEDIHRDLFNGNIFSELARLDKKDVSEESYQAFLKESFWPRKRQLTPINGIREVIDALSRDFIMVINSSSDVAEITEYLEIHDLGAYFSKIYSGEIKSKEEKFQMILGEFDVTSDNCVLITDTLGDVIEAQTSRIPSIVVLWGYQEKRHFASLETSGPLIEDPSHLVDAVKKSLSEPLVGRRGMV